MALRKTLRRHPKARNLAVENLECRKLLAASMGWDGPGLGSANLSYYIANSPASLTSAQTQSAVETALKAWSDVADIQFTQVFTPGLRDSIDISFARIDGVGGTLAQAYFPDDVNSARLAGDIQVDIAESWEVGNSLGNRAFDLTLVLAHEIGHSLGLDHSSSTADVLAPYVMPTQVFAGLSAHDIAGILSLYAPAANANTSDVTPPNAGNNSSATNPESGDSVSDPENTTEDTDNDAFPRDRWRRGGSWQRFGGRTDFGRFQFNYINPADVNSDNQTSPVDALMIINLLNQGINGIANNVDFTGLCDTNGDGVISTLDALTVINTLNQSTNNSILSDSSSDPATDPSTETTAVPSVDSTLDDTDSPSSSEESGETNEEGQEVDDEASDEYSTEGDCEHERPANFIDRVLTRLNPDDLIARYDTDGDLALSEAELPARLGVVLNEFAVDLDSDGLLTGEELSAAVLAARQKEFDAKDSDANGQLTEEEVTSKFWEKISTADVDQDGTITFQEFDTWLSSDPFPHETPHRHHHHQHRQRDSAPVFDAIFARIGRGLRWR